MHSPGKADACSTSGRGHIVLLGDIQLGRQVDFMLSRENSNTNQFRDIWGNTAQAWLERGSKDAPPLVCANLDCAITSATVSDAVLKTREHHFRTHPANAAVLREGGVDVVSLANKHTRDFRSVGLLDTMRVLKRVGVQYAGAGVQTAAARGVVINKGSLRYGFIAFADGPVEWQATTQSAGVNYLDTGSTDARASAVAEVTRFKAECSLDLVIVSMHWGPNWCTGQPPAHITNLFRDMIDGGADVIHGHGSHVFMGVEVYKHGAIIYNSGSFINDYFVDNDRRNDLGFVYSILVEGGRLQRIELHPVTLTQRYDKRRWGSLLSPQVNMARKSDRSLAIKLMTSMSKALGTQLHAKPKSHAIFVSFPGDTLEPRKPMSVRGVVRAVCAAAASLSCFNGSGFKRVQQDEFAHSPRAVCRGRGSLPTVSSAKLDDQLLTALATDSFSHHK